MDGSNGAQKLLPERALQQIAARACMQRPDHLDIAGVGGEHDDSRLGKFRADCLHGFQACHLRHLQVHQRHIGAMGAELLDRLAAVRRITHDDHARVVGDQDGNACSRQGMIVCDDNPNRSGIKVHGPVPSLILAPCLAPGQQV
jgi:hypothetical protein